MTASPQSAVVSKARPDYFQPIQDRAARRWDQLEADPELAGPWHQLFKQVQSPRHILSELLQNADDAGASQSSWKVTQRMSPANAVMPASRSTSTPFAA